MTVKRPAGQFLNTAAVAPNPAAAARPLPYGGEPCGAGIPASPGVTHWPSRRLADWLDQVKGISVSHDSIAAQALPPAAPHRGVQVLHRPAARS
jgi:hypothetical protein